MQTYWGGGSMFTATSALRWQLLRAAPDGLEDGTLPFYEIMALSQGLDVSSALEGRS